MKNIIGAFIMALLAVCIALPNLVFAGAEGSSASGSFKFSLDDGETRFVEFKASELAEGVGEGEMTLSDPAAIPVDDPDNPDKEKATPGVLVRAKFDCMATSKNQAIIGGEIFDSNVPAKDWTANSTGRLKTMVSKVRRTGLRRVFISSRRRVGPRRRRGAR